LVLRSTEVQLNGGKQYDRSAAKPLIAERHWQRVQDYIKTQKCPPGSHKRYLPNITLVKHFQLSKEYPWSYNHESLPHRNHLHAACGHVACGSVPRLRPRRPTSLLLRRERQRQRYILLLQRLHHRQLRQHRSISPQRPHLLSRRRSYRHQRRLRHHHLPSWFCHTTYRQRDCGQHCRRCH